jgi:hypothetical protein
MIKLQGGDGTTQDKAIEILWARDNQEGIDAEYEIISEMLGERFIDWELVRQTLIQEEDKSYDQIEIKSGDEHFVIWFDITDFFGK